MDQLDKRFSAELVKLLLQPYSEENMERKEIPGSRTVHPGIAIGRRGDPDWSMAGRSRGEATRLKMEAGLGGREADLYPIKFMLVLTRLAIK